ncbi:hypothetical protein QBC44DRAFT_371500 [Cladorrhinum sp. PSN332]|nr:hypothetical protein QBC44DRAFT_371500 [Cladorrhinum sp. PSN332]
MSSFSLKSFLLTAVALLPVVFANTELVDENMEALKTKNPVFGDFDFFDTRHPRGGLEGLPAARYTKHEMPWGTVPNFCLEYATQQKDGKPYCENIYALEVYEVEYDDCPGHTIPMCRCPDAPLSIDDLSYDLGKIPIKARQWVTSVTARPSHTGDPEHCDAAAPLRGIWMNGNCKRKENFWFHEVAHILDHAALPRTEPDRWYWSEQAQWRNTVIGAADCVPDNYSLTGWAESFAQFAVLAAYHHNVQDLYEAFPGDELNCLGYPLDLVIELTRNLFAPNQVCDESIHEHDEYSEYVCMGPQARAQGACEDVPDWQGPFYRGNETAVQAALETYQNDVNHVWGSSTKSLNRRRRALRV